MIPTGIELKSSFLKHVSNSFQLNSTTKLGIHTIFALSTSNALRKKIEYIFSSHITVMALCIKYRLPQKLFTQQIPQRSPFNEITILDIQGFDNRPSLQLGNFKATSFHYTVFDFVLFLHLDFFFHKTAVFT